MAGALCVFYPQTRFRETFGLIGAEANALGTPVLAPAGIGALSEVLGGGGQLLYSMNATVLVQQLEKWRGGQCPSVFQRAEFHPMTVAKHWMTLIYRRSTGKTIRNRDIEERLNSLTEPGEA